MLPPPLLLAAAQSLVLDCVEPVSTALPQVLESCAGLLVLVNDVNYHLCKFARGRDHQKQLGTWVRHSCDHTASMQSFFSKHPGCTQVLSTRKRKDVEVADIKVQVCLFAFDCLYLNGSMLLQRPLTERRAALSQAVHEKPGELQYALFKVWPPPLQVCTACGLCACVPEMFVIEDAIMSCSVCLSKRAQHASCRCICSVFISHGH